MSMSKDQAKKVADALCACPFCGNRLEASIRGSGEHAVNPKAKCVTEDCMGSKLPVICLDVPSQVDAWNRRAQPPEADRADWEADRVPYAWEVTQGGRTFLLSAQEFTGKSYDWASFKPLYQD